MGIEIDPETMKPFFDHETMESNVRGIYLAGVVTAGKETGKIFIENGRFHGGQIINALRIAFDTEQRIVGQSVENAQPSTDVLRYGFLIISTPVSVYDQQ